MSSPAHDKALYLAKPRELFHREAICVEQPDACRLRAWQ